MEIEELVKKQRAYFYTGKTRSCGFRLKALERLEASIKRNEQEIQRALSSDLNKSSFESFMTEVGLTLSELSYARKHLAKWMREQRVLTPLSQFHARSYVIPEPYGVALVMSPWNYPFMLCLEPLIGAVAAGNCCVLKPSAYSPATSEVIKKIISEAFPEEYVAVVLGGRRENTQLSLIHI